MRFLLALSLVASAAVGALAAEELKIDVTQEVECDRRTQKGDTIEAHYRGTLASNGNKFDASYDRGTPFSFKLGVGQVIKGWDIGMEGACVSFPWTLTVPPELGYGNRGMGPIPAGSTLIFEIEIVGIKGVPTPESIVTKAASSASSTASEAVEETASGVAGKRSLLILMTDWHDGDFLPDVTIPCIGGGPRGGGLDLMLGCDPEDGRVRRMARDEFWRQHPRLGSAVRAVRPYTPPLNFITLHYAYFVTVCLVASVVFWGSSDPKHSISYTDSLFLVISAMTEAGLNTVNLSQMTTWQQVLLWLLIILGSSVWVSIWTVLARKHAFEIHFEGIVRRSRLRSTKSTEKHRTMDLPIARKLGRTFGKGKKADLEPGPGRISSRNPATGSRTVLPISGPVAAGDPAARDHIAFADVGAPSPKGATTGFNQGDSASRRHVSNADTPEYGEPLSRQLSHRNFLTSKKVGRNAQFHDLTAEEREQLGGTEYRALKVLAVAVPIYFFSWQILGCVALGAWIANNKPQPALDNAINPWWNGIFNGVSAFNNSGMSVLDLNMIPYGSSRFVLVVMGAMILAGNTAYPVFLRLWFWTTLKLLNLATYEESFGDLKLTLEYILKYPRRVYTNLFPSRMTWWLLFMLFVLNGTDWVAFEILNLGNPGLADIPVGSRIIDGLFQAVVLYVIMMYISVYPVVITMRNSNVYEERSLGIYADDMESASMSSSIHTSHRPGSSRRPTTASSVVGRALRHTLTYWDGVGAAPSEPTTPESRTSFVSHQVRGQLSHDLWWLVLAIFAIVTIETQHFLEDPVTYSVFNVVFEVVSAYGCVGISVGVPFNAFSFAGGMYTGSKLVLCLVMLRGRHRGLPVALDRAVRLPGMGDEDGIMGRHEEEDWRIRRSMSMRRPSGDHGGGGEV
ncbi:cation transport protein-domain-containing protein [Xylariales sp. AK1849]|nr:cation transport protein-domain-containing protein [Xylariales sp. AK1849]